MIIMKRRLELPVRKSNRLKDFDYSSNGLYFVTICTKDKADLFWNPVVGADIIRPPDNCDYRNKFSEYGKTVETAILNISEKYPTVVVDKYCVMPNHIHLIVYIGNEYGGRIISAPTLSVVIGQMKSWVTKMCGFPIWQKSFHDHIIRNKNDYLKISEYIEQNPIRWELDCYYIDNPNKI